MPKIVALQHHMEVFLLYSDNDPLRRLLFFLTLR